ncbi:MAG: hypothetical protein WCB32_19215 [Pseudolabrys sp.]
MAVTILVTAAQPVYPGSTSDAEALAIVHNHCIMCHAVKPTHESFQEAPKNISLETVADLKKHAATIYAQTIQTKAIPLGNQTVMTDDERTTLGRWLKELP